MSQHQARQAFLQVSNRPALVAPSYVQHRTDETLAGEASCGLIADLRQFAAANRKEQMELFEQRKVELVMAMGYGNQYPAQEKPFAFANGKAIIPVHGYLMNRFAYSWGFVTGYNFIRSQVEAASNDPEVDGIILDVNSYGGTTAGCAETGEVIFNASARNGGKPILAVIDSSAYSAAYWAASAADRAVSAPTAGCGSIGVLFTHMDSSAALDKMGLKITYITAPNGGKKAQFNSSSSLSAEDIQDAQAVVDKMYDGFVTAVARNRGLTKDEVIATEARSFYIAEDALALGLIDAIQEPTEAIESFFNACDPSDCDEDDMDDDGDTDDTDDDDDDPSDSQVMRMATQQNGNTPVTTAEPKPAKIDPAVLQAAVTQAIAEQLPQAVATAVSADRDRMNQIMHHAEAKERPMLAKTLAMEGMSVEAAVRILSNAAKETPSTKADGGENHFKTTMDNSQNPQVGAGGGNEGEKTPQGEASRIVALATRNGVFPAKRA